MNNNDDTGIATAHQPQDFDLHYPLLPELPTPPPSPPRLSPRTYTTPINLKRTESFTVPDAPKKKPRRITPKAKLSPKVFQLDHTFTDEEIVKMSETQTVEQNPEEDLIRGEVPDGYTDVIGHDKNGALSKYYKFSMGRSGGLYQVFGLDMDTEAMGMHQFKTQYANDAPWKIARVVFGYFLDHIYQREFEGKFLDKQFSCVLYAFNREHQSYGVVLSDDNHKVRVETDMRKIFDVLKARKTAVPYRIEFIVYDRNSVLYYRKNIVNAKIDYTFVSSLQKHVNKK